MHAITAMPSRKTVQAPHSPSAQPFLRPDQQTILAQQSQKGFVISVENFIAFPIHIWL